MAIYKAPGSKKKKKSPLGKIIVSLFLIMLLCAGGAAAFLYFEISGGEAGEALTVTVPQGASTASIAALLEEKGLVSHSLIFRLYSRFTGADGSYTHGDHTIAEGSSYAEMVYELQQTTYEEIEVVNVTFPEGTTAYAMALQLEEKGLCTAEEFISSCNNDTFDVSFFSEISENENKFIKLEGFLFPDTYAFAVNSSAHDIIEKMLRNFESRIYTDELKAQVAASGLTLEQNIILASIIEREALGDESFGMVAGVFHNRLNNTDVFPCLESCTSAEHLPGNFIYGVLGYYFNGDAEPYVRNIPRSMVAAYDTYATPGLPVGAICNPGSLAITSTLNPTEHDYYFFVTDKNGQFYWGKTAAEHERNIQIMNQVNAG